MMGKGRTPIPRNIKKMQGSINSTREIDHIEGDRLIEIPPHPEEFTELEVRLWDAMTMFLWGNGILQEVGLPNIVAYCGFMPQHLEARAWIRENGGYYTITSRDGNKIHKRHPLQAIAIESMAEARKIGAEFGLSPAMQTKIERKVTRKDDDDFS